MKNILSGKDERLIGLSKKELIQKIGDGCNFYLDHKWSYIVKKYWYGKTRVLYLEFDDNDIVIAQYTISKYGKE
ncbi:hypothetical protein [Chryseobacterium indologenes]|uniref:Uncharacterized protein n=1 Tax=Chryseobacterium indologenes TaxID=253 RepID=A0A0N0ZWL5_CHRID|nr:hypothetical protein [Chryseobacterium indologenes]KPE52938.1 hypothetical protein AOB46_02835 [Chryseobacterium indologenes]